MKDHNFNKLQQRVYDAIMRGEHLGVIWPVGAGKTYLYHAVKEDLEALQIAASNHFKGEEPTLSVLNEGEIETLKTMAIYWREVFGRDEEIKGHILAGELGQVIHMLGAEKVLHIIMAYVNRVIDEE